MKKSISLILLLFAQVTGVFAQNPPQDFPEILDEIEMIPVMVNGDNNNRINILFLNQWRTDSPDAYNKPEMRAEFLKDIEESFIAAITYGHEDAHTAYAHYKEFFNVYALWWPTAPAWVNSVGQPKVEYLIRHFFLPWKNEYTGWATVLIMPNSIGGGGGAGRDLELRKGSAVIAGNDINPLLHEIAHTCMSIGDEYTTHATGTTAVPTYSVAMDYRRDEVKWRKWIDPETPIPTPYTKEYVNKVGVFEGTQYHLTDYYRNSAQGCIMGSGVFDNISEMCVTCNQRVVMRVNSLVDIINSTTPANKDLKIKGASSMDFAVDHIKPYPNSQVVRWYLNGKLLDDAMNKDAITVNFGNLESYQLICEITDESDFIRPDPPYAAYPVREVVWNITNSNSKAESKELAVEIKEAKGALTATVKGGKAPYIYMWADGSDASTIQNATAGIYNLTVVDSDFKTGSAKHIIYEKCADDQVASKNGSKLSPTIEVFAAEKGIPSGKIVITAPEGCEYSYVWGDKKHIYGDKIIYEGEDCTTTMGNTIKSYWTANGGKYIEFNGNEGSVSWDIEVAKAGVYPIEIIYAPTKSHQNPVVKVSANTAANSGEVICVNTRPLYTGWDPVKVYLKLDQGKNKITIESKGGSLPNIDYIRVADSYTTEDKTCSSRRALAPGTYSVAISDKEGNRLVEQIVVGEEAPFVIEEKLQFAAKGNNGVTIKNPVAGYNYVWYATEKPLLYAETCDNPIAVGTEFYPTEPGNYYVAARKTSTKMESSNRVGVAVSKKCDAPKATPISPDKFTAEERLMWYDASDMDADGVTDYLQYERGPMTKWMEKGEVIGKRGVISSNYYPNGLNGMAVGGWDKEWVSPSGKNVVGYQTIILVYKESDMSFAGTAPFRGSMLYMGKAENSRRGFFDPSTKRGRTFLNGRQIGVLTQANPMEFCTLTVELPEPGRENSGTTEGYWEGSVAEIMMFNRKLTDEERMGVEEYLRLKWFAGVELDF